MLENNLTRVDVGQHDGSAYLYSLHVFRNLEKTSALTEQ